MCRLDCIATIIRLGGETDVTVDLFERLLNLGLVVDEPNGELVEVWQVILRALRNFLLLGKPYIEINEFCCL